MKGRRFKDIESIKKSATAKLNGVPLSHCFSQLSEGVYVAFQSRETTLKEYKTVFLLYCVFIVL